MKFLSVRRAKAWMGLAVCAMVVGACSKASGPKDVLSNYLRLDSEAAGLSASTWPEMGQYMTATQAPSWNTFMVIDRYEIGQVKSGSTRAEVDVTYYPIGKLGATFEPVTAPEMVSYHLNKVGDQWKVDSPLLIPHVSWPVMHKRLDDASASNPKAKMANDTLIAQISAVAPAH